MASSAYYLSITLSSRDFHCLRSVRNCERFLTKTMEFLILFCLMTHIFKTLSYYFLNQKWEKKIL